MHFEATELTDGERALQRDVRVFLATELGETEVLPGLGFNSAKDPEFSRRLAARGWVGMTIALRRTAATTAPQSTASSSSRSCSGGAPPSVTTGWPTARPVP